MGTTTAGTCHSASAATFAITTSARAQSIVGPRWLGPRQAARLLGVDLTTLKVWRESAGLPHHHRGNGGYLYEAHSLDAWLAAHGSASRPKRLSRYSPAGDPSASEDGR